jgi:2-dehydro-3-deoxy-D-arabinonate dehydratase
MKLFKTTGGPILQSDKDFYKLEEDWDTLINRNDLFSFLNKQTEKNRSVSQTDFDLLIEKKSLAPIGKQEVWAAGVTYLRSRDARMKEAKTGGNADCYEKVYEAERPELFFKALPHRVAANNEEVYIRKDSKWNVPEPELVLFINSHGNIQAYTIGNDMSSRDIEGENPLYLPQAKVYERSAALGPCLYVPQNIISKETSIHISIERENKKMFADQITLAKMKRSLAELASFLFRECDFKFGCFLMTGTGMVPPADFSLQVGDIVTITIDNIGSLKNTVAMRP